MVTHTHKSSKKSGKKSGYPYELIGKEIIVISSTHAQLRGLRGKVVDETKATFRLKCVDGLKTILKSAVNISVNGHEVHGRDLLRRSEERTKH